MKAVFDTNIVASASFWRGKPFDCLTAWALGKCGVVVSPQLLSEYFETVEELSRRYPQKTRVQWLEALTQSAELVFPMESARGVVKDRDDEMVLECAAAAGVDFLVTGDKLHLLPVGEWRGVKIVTAADFLSLF